MVAVPNTNVYLVVLDGGDCPDSAIKCTSVSNSSFAVWTQYKMKVVPKNNSAATMATLTPESQLGTLGWQRQNDF